MKIENVRTFDLGAISLGKTIFVPREKSKETVKVSKEFIETYQSGRFDNLNLYLNDMGSNLILGLCVMEKESWVEVAKDIKKKEGWVGASLVMWQLYIMDGRDAPMGTVTLTGVRYRDNELIEWVPLVHYQSRRFLRDATEVSMKRSSSLYNLESRTVLVSKIEPKETK